MDKMTLKPMPESFRDNSFAPNSDALSHTWKNEVHVVLHCEHWFSQYPNMEMSPGHQKWQNIKPEITFNVTGLILDRKYDMFLSLSIVGSKQYTKKKGFVETKKAADNDVPLEIAIGRGKSGKVWMEEVIVCKKFKIAREKCDESIDNKCFHVKMDYKYMPIVTIREHENPQTAAYFLLGAAMFYTVGNYKNQSMGFWKKTYLWSKEKIEKHQLEEQRKSEMKQEAKEEEDDHPNFFGHSEAFLSVATSQASQIVGVAPQNLSFTPSSHFSSIAQLLLSNTTNPISFLPLPIPPTQQSYGNLPYSSGSSL